jgi:VWFA-related protein
MRCARIRGVALVAALIAFAAAGTMALLAQGQPLRVETVFVQTDVYVSDDRGNPLTDLTAEDFEIYEERVRKPIDAFRAVRIPLPGSLAPAASAVPPAPPGAAPDAAAAEGRTYIIVLDDLHIAAANAPRVRLMLAGFVDRGLGPDDRAAVATSSGPSIELTTDRAAVKRAIDRFTGKGLRSPTSERLQDPRVNLSGRIPPNADPFEIERGHRAHTTFDLLVSIGQRLRSTERRRITMVFVSEGVEIDEPGRRGSGASAWTANRDLNRALDALSLATIVVYTIDPRGNATGAEGLIESSTVLEPQGLGVRSTRREMRQSQSLLTPLAANTGGAALLWRPDMAPSFERIVRESSQYYLIGYSAPPLPSRPEFRRIEVRVKRPGARVAARSGYIAAR